MALSSTRVSTVIAAKSIASVTLNWLVHDGAGAGDAGGHFQSRHQIAGDKECESSEDLVVALMGTMPFIQ